MPRDDLFASRSAPGAAESTPTEEESFHHQPLAARMRPRNLEEFTGQSHLLGPGQLLRRAIEADRIQSLIFYGPPGTGKTSLAQIIANQTKSKFERLSGVESNVADTERGLGRFKMRADEAALRHLAKVADGDARKALNSLEIAALTTAPANEGFIHIDLAVAEQCIQKKAVVYDGDGDAHYDTISAFIKSMRGSEPDAALYWLAKMIHAGEDPRFIARRIVIHAAEDVGLADPMALVLANAAFQAAEFIGWPEARIPIAEAAIYIATAHKSNSVIAAVDAALADVRSGRTLAVPEHLRDASDRGAEKLGHGTGYKYAHDFPEHFVAQDYLGAEKRYYEPTAQGLEKKIKERVEHWRSLAAQSQAESPKSEVKPEADRDS